MDKDVDRVIEKLKESEDDIVMEVTIAGNVHHFSREICRGSRSVTFENILGSPAWQATVLMPFVSSDGILFKPF